MLVSTSNVLEFRDRRKPGTALQLGDVRIAYVAGRYRNCERLAALSLSNVT